MCLPKTKGPPVFHVPAGLSVTNVGVFGDTQPADQTQNG